MSTRIAHVLLASLAPLLTAVGPVQAATPSTTPVGPATFSCGPLGDLTGSGTQKSNEKTPLTWVDPTDPDGYNQKYVDTLSLTLTDAAGAVYAFKESYSYAHTYKVDRAGNVTVNDSYSWTQTLTDPTGAVSTGTDAQTLVTVNGAITTLGSVNTPFPCDGPL